MNTIKKLVSLTVVTSILTGSLYCMEMEVEKPRMETTRASLFQKLQVIRQAAPWSACTSVALNATGTMALTGSSHAKVCLWDVRTGELKHEFKLPVEGNCTWAGIDVVQFGPDGKSVLISAMHGTKGTVCLYDIEDINNVKLTKEIIGNCFGSASAGESEERGRCGKCYAAAFGPDGEVFVGSMSTGPYLGEKNRISTLYNVKAEQPKIMMEFDTNKNTARSVSFDKTGRYILIGSFYDSTARLWDTLQGEQIKKLTCENDRGMHSTALSPDGKTAIAGTNNPSRAANYVVCIWDVESGNIKKLLAGHTDMIGAVTYSQDSNFILSGSIDTTARIWDADSGKELQVLNGHTGTVGSVAFSGDDSLIITGSYDGTAIIWKRTSSNQ